MVATGQKVALQGEDQLKDFIQGPRVAEALARVAPPTVSFDPGRFAALAMKAITADVTGKLASCTRASLMLSLLHAAELGLDVGGPKPKAYIIPYWNRDKNSNEAQFQVGVWGLKELAERSGKVAEIWADVVYSKDTFRVLSGSGGRRIEHEPRWELDSRNGDRGELMGAYSCCRLKTGEVLIELVNAADLKKAREANRGKSPAWDGWGDEMRKKVALKRGSKYWPEPDGDLLHNAVMLDDNPSSTTLTSGTEVQQLMSPRGVATSPLDRIVASREPVEAVGEEAPPKSEPPAPRIESDEDLHEALADWSAYWAPAGMREELAAWDDATRAEVIAWVTNNPHQSAPPACVLPPAEPGSDG